MDPSSNARGIKFSEVEIFQTLLPNSGSPGFSVESYPTTTTKTEQEDHKAPMRKLMEDTKKVVTCLDTESDIIGHEDVQTAILNAFLLSNTLAEPMDHSITSNKILICGLGGLGKTELVKSMAIKAAKWIKQPVSVFNVKCSDLQSKWIGDSEKNVSALWDAVEHNAPSLVMFDEADGLMKSRSKEETDASRRFKTELLAELRGNRKLKQVVVIAATNKPFDLDANFISRFPLRFVVKPPTPEERKQLFDKFLSNYEKCGTVEWTTLDYKLLQQRTKGFSGNDIASVIGVAASLSLRTEFEGQFYTTKELVTFGEKIAQSDKPVTSVLRPMTMEIILAALTKIPASIHANDVKELNNWARKHCGMQELKASLQEKQKSASEPSNSKKHAVVL